MPCRLSYRRYRRELRLPLRTAHGPWTEREGIFVRVEAEDGRVGFGEIAPIPWFGTETVAEAEEMLARFGGQVDAASLANVPAKFGALRFALDCALLPAAAVSAKARVPLTALLPAGKAALALLPGRLEQGWLTFKWKVGVAPADEELGLLDDLIAALPAYAKLRLDANGAWTRKVATRWLDRCADRPVEFVEQPLAPEDRDGLLGLANDFPVKLALDESVVRIAEAQRWQSDGWSGVFVLKPALAGPLDELLSWVTASKADVVLSSAIETALARSAIVNFARAHAETLLKRAPGFGIGEVFGDRRWDGPILGAVLDEGWSRGVSAEDLWNAAS